MNLDIKDYVLIRPDYIKVKKEKSIFYDITVDEDHTFNIVSEDHTMIVLSHNCDGAHITSLIINLFYKWFPWVIVNHQLTMLRTPLVSVGDGKKRKYFFELEDFKKAKPTGNIRYLKGLGSLEVEDWEYVMANKDLSVISNEGKSKESLEMAFGDSADVRKNWLKTGTYKI